MNYHLDFLNAILHDDSVYEINGTAILAYAYT
jgi:hypothetical protein